MKKILVTGGAGFIGSHLISYLLKQNNHVTCIDSLYSGSKSNILNYKKNKNFVFIKKDVTKKINGKYDFIYNLACPASPIHYQKNPIYTFKSNIYGAINVLENAYKNNCTVLHTSTSEVYGDPLQHPQKETYYGNVSCTGPRSCYDEGKRAAESIFFDYKRLYNTKIKIIRIFNTYGPNMQIHDGRVISNFIFQCLKNKNITIYGDGMQTRSFCYVDDLIKGIIKYSYISDFTGPINLGNPKELKIIDIAKKIKKITLSKSQIVYKKMPIHDPKKRKPNINLAKKILKWEPKISLEVGLIKTIKYFSKIID